MKPFLEVKNLKKHFPIHGGLLLRVQDYVKAVDGVSFQIQKGQTFGIVGESGCGKSTLGRTIAQIYKPTEGEILYKGQNITTLKKKESFLLKKQMQMIFQDPYASLNPRMTIHHIVGEPLTIHKQGSAKEIKDKVAQLLEFVGLKTSHLNRYPHEFSGGQRQRIGVARAIALNPQLIICDEMVSALDVSIQAQILNLMKDLQEQLGLTYIFISHDLSVVKHMCDLIAVMYLGKIVEIAPYEELYKDPKHPYTQFLLKSIPIVKRGKVRNRELLKGDVPSPINPPKGCSFHPRCPYKKDICNKIDPQLINMKKDQKVACVLYS